MTHIVVLGSRNMDLVTYTGKARAIATARAATVPSVQRPGASASMPCRPESEAQFAS
ncbi:hypothetical protein [Streptomyces sp. NPDC001137]|uniref:hypothetical protein n=1 Tax=Streptomyces sp. NPDC001137 TaxID=3154378 RepID=UPI00331FDF2A